MGVNFFDQEDVEQLQRDLITMGIFEVDECLRRLAGREIMSTAEVIDMLLDVRQTLDTYYVHKVET
jgi:hypothetical protein